MTNILKTLVLTAAVTLALTLIPTNSNAEVILNYPVAYPLVTVPYTVLASPIVTPVTYLAPEYVPVPVFTTAPVYTYHLPYTCYTILY